MSAAAVEYSARVRELFAALPGCGELQPGPGLLVTGEAEALSRGAWVRFEARVQAGRFTDCRYRAWGCPHVLAAAALACARLRNSGIDAAPAWNARELAAELQAPAEKLGRLLVVEDALEALFSAARAMR